MVQIFEATHNENKTTNNKEYFLHRAQSTFCHSDEVASEKLRDLHK